MKRRLVILIALLAGAFSAASAGNGGSGYSRYGFGDIRYIPTSDASGMGGAGLAIVSRNSLNYINPAAWARISSTEFTVSALYEGLSTTDGRSSAYLSGTDFDGLMLAVPISTDNGIVAAAGLVPYSTINYNIVTAVSQAGLDYTLSYYGEGGLSRGFLGLSWSPLNDIHTGAALNYYFGTLRHTITQAFYNALYNDAEDVRAAEARGIGFTFGAAYTGLGEILHMDTTSSLSLGATFSTTSYLTLSEDHEYSFTTGSTVNRDTIVYAERKIPVPFALGIGLAYSTDRWLIAADVYYQRWGKLYSAGVVVAPSPRDSYRFSLGGEWLPRPEYTASFGQRIGYRLGTYYDESYYQVSGTPVNEIGFSAGIDLPIFHDVRFGDTRLAIGAQYALRGTTDKYLQKDRILRISFTINGSEPWFIRPEEE